MLFVYKKELANYGLRSKSSLRHGFVKRAFIGTQSHPFVYSLQWQSWLVTQQNATETILPAKTNIYHLDICSSFGNILDQISAAQNVEQWLFLWVLTETVTKDFKDLTSETFPEFLIHLLKKHLPFTVFESE